MLETKSERKREDLLKLNPDNIDLPSRARREMSRLTIHVGGLRFSPGVVPPAVVAATPGAIGPRDLADSGTDVA